MTAPTQPVTVRVADFGGEAIAGVTVTARMDNVDYTGDGTFVANTPVTGTTDVNGEVVLECFPNALPPTGLGTRGTVTRFIAQLSNSRSLDVLALVPDTPCNLVNILVDENPTPLTDAEIAVQQAQAAAANSSASASASAVSAGESATSAVAASGSAIAAAGSATAAAGSVTAAGGSATAAAGSATAAAGSATAAAGSETTAAGSATAAATARAGAEAASSDARAAALAASNALGTAGIHSYASTAAGLALTANGQTFYVPHASIANVLVQYLNTSGVAGDTGRRFNETTGAELGTSLSLLDTEPQGIAVDVTSEDASVQVKVIDAVTPANNYLGDLITFVASTCFPNAKIVTLQDGTLGWSDHNLLFDSEGFNSGNWVRTTLTASAPSGGLSTLTATSVVASLRAPAQLLEPERYYTATFIGKQGTAPYAYVRLQATTDLYAYFNLSNGTVGSVDAGATANIYTTYADGSPLPAGEYRMVVSRQVPSGAASVNAHYGLADANASTAVTNGRTGFLRRSALSFGKKSTQYLLTTAGARYGIPYDWSKGGRRVLIEEFTTRFESKYGDDLTQAAWTKTSTSAALDATGPHGEPCSTLTASGANGTCLQAFTGAFPTNTFQAQVKRKTGTGNVYMTIDGGASYTDITALINSATFSRLYIHGSSTAVNMGFKLATSGDAIYVSLAVNGGKAAPAVISAPVTTYGAALYQHANDLFRIPVTKFNATTPFTALFDFETSDDTNASAEAAGLVGAADSHFIQRTTDGVIRISNVSSSVYTNSLNDRPSSLRIEGAMRIKANDVAASVNGTGECYDNRPGVGSLTNLAIGSVGGQMFLRRILVVPRALPDDGLAKWRYSGSGADARYLADIKVGKFQEVANTFICREPNCEVLRDTDDYALISTVFMQRYITANPGSGEAPARLVQSTFKFDKATHTLTNLTGQVVVAQQASWTSGLGHQQGPSQIKLRYGGKTGRLLLLYSQLDSVSGVLEVGPDWRRMYCKYSDDNGVTWSAATMVFDPNSGDFAISTGPCSPAQITAGAHAGRIVVPFYRGAGCGVLYSDDSGVTWSSGTTINAGGEPTVHVLPDGQSLVLTMRLEASPWRSYATSTDGGATWSASTNMTLAEGTNVAMSIVQNDAEGGNSLYGEQLLVGPRHSSPTYLIRSKLTIEELKGAGLAVSGQQFCPLGTYRSTGYSCGRRINGGYLAIVYESAPTGVANNICDIRLMVVRWP